MGIFSESYFYLCVNSIILGKYIFLFNINFFLYCYLSFILYCISICILNALVKLEDRNIKKKISELRLLLNLNSETIVSIFLRGCKELVALNLPSFYRSFPVLAVSEAYWTSICLISLNKIPIKLRILWTYFYFYSYTIGLVSRIL